MAEKKVLVDTSDDCLVTHMEWKTGLTKNDGECLVKIARAFRVVSGGVLPHLEITLRSDLSLLNFFPNDMSRKVKLRIEFVTKEAQGAGD